MRIWFRRLRWLFEDNRLERIYYIAKTDFKVVYYENKLGLMWAILQPLSLVGVYYLVFDYLLDTQIENFVVHIFSGMIIWLFFADLTTRCINLLRVKRGLHENTNMHKMELFLAQLVNSTIGFFINFLLLVIISLLYGVWPTINYIWIVPTYINVALLSLGLGLILSSIFLFVHDLVQVWHIFIRIGFFLSPILYASTLFYEKVPWLMYLNPVSGSIINARFAILEGLSLDVSLYGLGLIYGLIFLMLGLVTFRKYAPYTSEFI